MPGTARSESPSAVSTPASAAEMVDQLLGQLLGVAARDCQRQQIFNNFMIMQPGSVIVQQTLPKPGAMARAVMATRGRIGQSASAGIGSTGEEEGMV